MTLIWTVLQFSNSDNSGKSNQTYILGNFSPPACIIIIGRN